MSVYPPPTDRGTLFNPVDYGATTTAITIDYLNANYLKFPVAQGLETMVGINNLDELVTKDYCMAANGYSYRRDKQGLFTEITQKLFDDRQKYKVCVYFLKCSTLSKLKIFF